MGQKIRNTSQYYARYFKSTRTLAAKLAIKLNQHIYITV